MVRQFQILRPDGTVCNDGEGSVGWQYPNDHAQRELDYYLDTFTSSGWITVDTARSAGGSCGFVVGGGSWNQVTTGWGVHNDASSTLYVYVAV